MANEITVEKINEEILELRKNGYSIKGISDGHHTFGGYIDMISYQFIVMCSLSKNSWKSKKHFDEINDPIEKFNGCFIAGINTPDGVITHHLKLEFWDLLDVKEIEHAPEYDGYTEEDCKKRMLSLIKKKEGFYE